MPDSVTEARALCFTAPRRIELRDEPLPAPAAGEVVVRGLASAVSQGTELLLYRGEGPARFDDSLAHADSTTTYPRRYGYSWVGEIVSGDPARQGQQVFALATHADAHVLRSADARAIPAEVPATRAVLAANLETAITCAWDAEAALGDRVVVLGGGVVGALSAWLIARSGASVTLVERSARRRRAAAALLPASAIVENAAPDARGDVVIEATGDPRALDAAVAWCAMEARVIVASFYGARRAPVDLGDAFHRRRLTLRATQVSTIPPRLAPRWTYARRWALVTELLREPGLDALVADPVPFERAAELYATLDRDDDLPPAHVFVYR